MFTVARSFGSVMQLAASEGKIKYVFAINPSRKRNILGYGAY